MKKMSKRSILIRNRRSAMTRRFYAFENTWFRNVGDEDTPMHKLRALGERIWRENTKRRDRCPTIVAARGWEVPGRSRLMSVCWGRIRIALCRDHRTPAVLIHEMAHALGPETHGKRFQNRFFDLMAQYAK